MYSRLLFLVLILSLNLYAFDNFLFDLDPIGNNQIILNSYNPNSLDTVSYKSIVFHQSHLLPYGTFIFNNMPDLANLDSTGVMTQFVHKKGDYRFRDLSTSLHKINSQGTDFRCLVHTRSYTPLNLYGINGSNFLQNYMFDLSKKKNDVYSSATFLYHFENPEVPLSYYTSNAVNYYNTRNSTSMLWGLTHRINKNKYFFEFKTSSQFSFMENNAINSDDNTLDEDRSFTNNSFDRLSSMKLKYYINELVLVFINLTEHAIERKQLSNDSDRDYSHQSYLFSSGIEFKNNNSLSLDVYKDLDSELIFIPNITINIFRNKKSYLVYKMDNFSHSLSDDFKYLLTINNRFEYSHNTEYFANDFSFGMINDDYLYLKMKNIYSKGRVGFGINFTSFFIDMNISKYYDNLDYMHELNNPIFKNQLNYFLKYYLPVKNKPYSFTFEVRGRYFEFYKGGINLNTIPMIVQNQSSKGLIRNYIDFVFGIKYDKFSITYHSVTNNGNDFNLDYPFSDIGSAFTIPEYSFFERDLSLFHYLKISWSFID